MYKTIISVLLILFSVEAYTQSKTISIAELDSRIKVAVEKENFEEAALLQKDKLLVEKLNIAIKNGEYSKASSIKDLISSKPESEIMNSAKTNTDIQAKIDIALKNEDYVEAARLQKQLNGTSNNNQIDEEEEKRKKEIEAKIKIAVKDGDYVLVVFLKKELEGKIFSSSKNHELKSSTSSSSSSKSEFMN